MCNMKKRVLFGILIIFLILSLSFIIGQEEETAEDKARACLEEKVEEKEVDMKSISDELKKKPPKTRSRSERRRRR